MSLVKMKDPQEILSFTIDWSTWLVGADTISTSTWAADAAGVTVDSDTNDTTTATVVISGGTAGESTRVTNTVTTVSSEKGERSVIVRTEQR